VNIENDLNDFITHWNWYLGNQSISNKMQRILVLFDVSGSLVKRCQQNPQTC
jgi:hypothetical protein